MVAVQRLYEACKAAFAADKPVTTKALQHVQATLDKVTAADVGLVEPVEGESQRGFGFFGNAGRRGARHTPMAPRWAPPITYLHLYECDTFQLGIFCLPTSASIPLHDHPGMVVFSKLLYGSLHVKAYDWADERASSEGGDRRYPQFAQLTQDQVLTAPGASFLLPDKHNIHAFTAITDCAVLDVLAPPYSAEEGRHCTYYCEVPAAAENLPSTNGEERDQSVGLTALAEFEPPDDFVVRGGAYHGPRIYPT